MRRCHRCASSLTFAGVQADGSQVFACTGYLYWTTDGHNFSGPCAPLRGEYLDDQGRVISPRWAPRNKKTGEVTLNGSRRRDSLPRHITVREHPGAIAARKLHAIRERLQAEHDARVKAQAERRAAAMRSQLQRWQRVRSAA